jgi:hypothetical protein
MEHRCMYQPAGDDAAPSPLDAGVAPSLKRGSSVIALSPGQCFGSAIDPDGYDGHGTLGDVDDRAREHRHDAPVAEHRHRAGPRDAGDRAEDPGGNHPRRRTTMWLWNTPP